MNWPGHRFAATLFAVVIALWLGGMLILLRVSALSATESGQMLVVFEPGIARDEAFAAIIASQARPVRETAFGFIWVVDGSVRALQEHGVMGAYRELPINPSIAGCVALADAKVANVFGWQ